MTDPTPEEMAADRIWIRISENSHNYKEVIVKEIQAAMEAGRERSAGFVEGKKHAHNTEYWATLDAAADAVRRNGVAIRTPVPTPDEEK